MRFSLILATLGRTEEIPRLLDSIAGQMAGEVPFRDIELIVVDQNSDDRLVPILERYRPHVSIVHLRSAPGLSRARNVGMGAVTGDIVAYPDDDAWYPTDLLHRVKGFFTEDPDLMGCTGLCTDGNGNVSVGGDCSRTTQLKYSNAWKCGVSASIFLRTPLLRDVGAFDEQLGLGSGTPFQSGEETDILIRAIARGYKIMFRPDLQIFHPMPKRTADRVNLQRTWGYAMGMGRVMHKHHYNPFWVLYNIARPVGGAAASLVCGKTDMARLRLTSAVGRLQGWLARETHVPAPPVWLSTKE